MGRWQGGWLPFSSHLRGGDEAWDFAKKGPIYKMFLRVTMPYSSKWDVPVKIIAENRARHYMKEDGLSFEESYNNQ